VFVMIRRQMLNLRDLATGMLGTVPRATRPEAATLHDVPEEEPIPEVMTAAGIA